MPRVLLIATTTGYQTRSFGEAAGRLAIELALATDRCHVLEDPWRDAAVPVRFHDEAGAVETIRLAAAARPFDGIVAVGDRPALLAAAAAQALGLPGQSLDGARASANKHMTRERLAGAGLPAPWFRLARLDADPGDLAAGVTYPCVVKPLALAGSRGVTRADDDRELRQAVHRLRRLLGQKDVRAQRDPAHERLLIEGFIAGREYALEGILEAGELRVLAIFDKPDPLDGPFFEETIYVTPPPIPEADQQAIVETVARAAAALGLRHGPIHAECRVNAQGVFVLEIAARPIGGLCSRALRFERDGADGPVSLEELLLRHAIGEPAAGYRREIDAAGVMMVPIPRRGFYKDVEGLEVAAAVPGIVDIQITARRDQLLLPLPEGASYLGFIFARAGSGAGVERALRECHARLRFVIEPALTLVE